MRSTKPRRFPGWRATAAEKIAPKKRAAFDPHLWEHSKGLGGSGEGTNLEQLRARLGQLLNGAVLFIAVQKKLGTARLSSPAKSASAAKRRFGFGETDAAVPGMERAQVQD